MRNMSQGLCLFDAGQGVVLANSRYAEIYGLTPEQVKPGTTLRQIFEARAANGLYNHLDAQKFVNEGVSGFGDEVSQIVRLSDGRSISVLRRPMADGGLVSTHEDVTVREDLSARLEEQNGLLRQREEELRAWNLRLDAALKNMSQGLCLYDARPARCDRQFQVCRDLRPDTRSGEARHHAAHDRRSQDRQRSVRRAQPGRLYPGAIGCLRQGIGGGPALERRPRHRHLPSAHAGRRLGDDARGHHRARASKGATGAAERAARRGLEQHDARARHVRRRAAAGGLQRSLC